MNDELETLIGAESALACKASRFSAWRKERVAAFSAEEMLFMICPLAKLLVLEGDVICVRDRSLTVMTARCKILSPRKFIRHWHDGMMIRYHTS